MSKETESGRIIKLLLLLTLETSCEGEGIQMNKGFMITAVLLEIIGILLILFWEINDKVAVISGIAIIVIGVVLFQVGYWRMIRARERRKNRN
jgi:hypothetical protein